MTARVRQPVCGRCGAPAMFFFRQPGLLSQVRDHRRFAACADPEHRAAAETAWRKHFSLDRKRPEILRDDPQGNLF